MHGKLTAIVRYWLRYQVNDKYIILSFGLKADVAVNSIIGLPTLRKWSGNLDFGNNVFVAPKFKRKFPIHYEPTTQGSPPSVIFDHGSFIRPSKRNNKTAQAFMTNVQITLSDSNIMQCARVAVNNNTNTSDCFKREFDLYHIE